MQVAGLWVMLGIGVVSALVVLCLMWFKRRHRCARGHAARRLVSCFHVCFLHGLGLGAVQTCVCTVARTHAHTHTHTHTHTLTHTHTHRPTRHVARLVSKVPTGLRSVSGHVFHSRRGRLVTALSGAPQPPEQQPPMAPAGTRGQREEMLSGRRLGGGL